MNLGVLKSKIKKEVADFHPLLRDLLPRLPRVETVDYTHGSNELGADFLVKQRNDVSGDQDIVAVIAKVGDINQGDRAELQRQIDETLATRPAGPNNQPIRIDVIWITTTGRIGKNVREILGSANIGRTLVFLDGDIIVRRINENLPEFWKDIPLEVALQLKKTANEISRIDHDFDLIQHDSSRFYVKQTIIKKEFQVRKSHKWNQKKSEIDFVRECLKNDRTLVEGEFGFGKSKLLRHTVLELTEDASFAEHEVFPHYFGFWNFVSNYESDFAKFLNHRCQEDSLFGNACSHIVFLDGFDETAEAEQEQNEALQRVCASASNTGVKVVISSRPLIDLTRDVFKNLGFSCLELSPLSLNQLLKFVKYICERFAQEATLVEEIKKSPLIQDLPKSPISAILLAQVLSQTEQDLPATLPELYSKYMDLMLGRWDIEKGLQSDVEYKALSGILPLLADFFVNNRLPSISEDEARGYFSSYLAERNLDVDPEVLFKKAVSRSGLLVRSPLDNTVSFKHPTFAEFLFAKKCAANNSLLIDERVLRYSWSTVFYFYFGIKSDCPDLIDQLSSIVPSEPVDRWGLIFFFPNYLLAASSTPYAHSEPILRKAVLEFVKIYEDISNGVVESPFKRLTKMEFLSLSVSVFERRYGYSFFERALENLSLELGDLLDSDKQVAIAGFFLGFARIKRSDPKLYDFVLENCSESLPMEMKIVLDFEARENKCRTTLLKKFQRRIGRELKAAGSAKARLEHLFERPMGFLKEPESTDSE